MAASNTGIALTFEQQSAIAVAKALRKEADGKELRKELIANLKTAVEPAVREVQGKLRAIPHDSPRRSSPPLGTALASKTKPQVRLSGRSAGVKVRITKTPALRGFTHAARYLNRGRWRRRVFGTDVWVVQQSPIPGYFDQTMRAGRRAYRKAVVAALADMTRRITPGR